jgi:hypothetical protein
MRPYQKSCGKAAAFLMFLILSIGALGHVEAAGTWSLTGSMSTARYSGHTATLLSDGRVLVSGGVSGSFDGLASAEIYDPALGTWSLTGSMSTARFYAHTATLLSDGRVLVSGGFDGSGNPVASAEIYDPALGTWSLTDSMSTVRYAHTATRLSDGRVLVSGGDNWSSVLASTEIYDPALGTWSSNDWMSTARTSHTATLLSDARVLVSGGHSGSAFLASAEIYDPAVGTWSLTDSMSTARHYDHTATLLSDGRVLVSGGINGSAFLASAEIYDPALGTWSLAGSMSTARYTHTATRLSDGRVLVSGGFNFSGVLASAEIFSIDTVAPTTTIALSPLTPDGANGWYVSNVHVTVSAADDPYGSGVAETRCVLDPASPPASFDAIPAGCAYAGAGANVTAEGPHTLYAASKDAAGNKETPVSANFKLDKTAPTLTVSNVSVNAASPAGALVASYPASSSDNLDPSPALSCVPAAPRTFPIGDSAVDCTAHDQAGNMGSASFTVHVGGAAEQLADLLSFVTGIGPGQSLAAKVKAAQAAVAAGKTASACGSLAALINEANAQAGKKLTAAQASAIVAAAIRIRAVLGC